MQTTMKPIQATLFLETCGGCGNALLSEQRITTYIDGVPEVFCSRKCVIDARRVHTVTV